MDESVSKGIPPDHRRVSSNYHQFTTVITAPTKKKADKTKSDGRQRAVIGILSARKCLINPTSAAGTWLQSERMWDGLLMKERQHLTCANYKAETDALRADFYAAEKKERVKQLCITCSTVLSARLHGRRLAEDSKARLQRQTCFSFEGRTLKIDTMTSNSNSKKEEKERVERCVSFRSSVLCTANL